MAIGDPPPVHLTVQVPDNMVAVPRGVAIGAVVAMLAALACVGLLVVGMILQGRELRDVREDVRAQTKEIRVLQLHSQDAESAMIRAGVATRKDFAAWESPQIKKE